MQHEYGWRYLSCRLPSIFRKVIQEDNMAEHRGGSGNFAENPEKASEAGKKGGKNSGGNFANDREKASEAGKKGGQNSHGGGRKSE
ncbi:general stress protein YciG [Pantoea anthophila]|nr:general stress protein YciG [Pantoea anthophila]